MAIVEIRNVSKIFPPQARGGTDVVALDDVSLDIEAGDIFGIVGYSGAGKSTLVRVINALETTTSGTINVAGVGITGLRERELQKVRLGIGMIFQQFNLFHSRTVWGNIVYPLQVAKVPKGQHQARVSELLQFVGLADKAHSYPDQLSGGQKQRVGIARALATSPRILLADESTSALDPETTQEVLALLKRVNEEFGITIVVITHEMEVIKSIAHKVAVMEAGRIVEQGAVFDIFANPREASTHRFVSTLVDDVPAGTTLDSLRNKHSGRIVTFSFLDNNVSQSVVFAELISRQIEFELIYGGIEDIQGSTFGHLTLALAGDKDAIDQALIAAARLVELKEAR